MSDRAFTEQQWLFMATVPGQAVAPFEQAHLDGRFVATGAHAFIATSAAATRFIRRSAATRAGDR
ncbi:hypothetical protein WH240_11910 [Gluconobacter wancherniae]|uniref:hypothetical protein n=1 Tax=Gluconobacter wancherniae TaxID=1307955 RepID=UPI0030AE0F91